MRFGICDYEGRIRIPVLLMNPSPMIGTEAIEGVKITVADVWTRVPELITRFTGMTLTAAGSSDGFGFFIFIVPSPIAARAPRALRPLAALRGS